MAVTVACRTMTPLVEAQGCVGCFTSIDGGQFCSDGKTQMLVYVCEKQRSEKHMSGNITNLGNDNGESLTIIARNTAPKREELYPFTWMLHSGGHAIRLHVAHDLASHPYIEDRCAA